MSLDELTDGRINSELGAFWRKKDAGFSSTRTDTGEATVEYGAEASYGKLGGFNVSGQLSVTETGGSGEDSTTQATVQVGAPVGERIELGAEVRRQDRETAGQADETETALGVRADVQVTPDVAVYGVAQTQIDASDNVQGNDLVTLGVEAQATQNLSLRGEASSGDRGQAYTVGADVDLSDKQKLTFGYTADVDNGTRQRKDSFSLGTRRKVSNRAEVFTEHQFSRSRSGADIAQVYGVNFAPTEHLKLALSLQSSKVDSDTGSNTIRDAASVSVDYAKAALSYSGKLEYRIDKGPEKNTQWLTTSNLRYQVNERATVQGRANLAVTRGEDEATFAEVSVGGSYRPTFNDRLNILGRYTYLYDLGSPGQQDVGGDERSHVFALEGIYALNRLWELGGKLSWKQGDVRLGRGSGEWLRTSVLLAVMRGRYHITNKWDGVVDYRYLRVNETQDSRHGFMVGVDRHVGKNLKVGVGYNFTDFNDDLTNLDFQSKGWFVNMLGKY